jgi:hypothetical protein
MKVRSPRLLGVVASVLVASGGAAALAEAQSGAKEPNEERSVRIKGASLDDLAERLGIERAKVDAALEDIALDEVDWALAAGFVTEAQAKALKERVKDGLPGLGRFGFGHFGHFGHFGFGHLGFGGGGLGLDGFLAAAQYLDLSATRLRNALEDKTLAEIAGDEGKSVDGLKQALLSASRESLADARADDALTQKQEDALLERLESNLDDIVNGRSTHLTALAERLDVEPAEIENALEAAAVARVDQALEDGLITKAKADALKKKIEADGALGHAFGKLGFGFGELGFGFGKGKLELEFGFEKFGFGDPGFRRRGDRGLPFGGAFGEPDIRPVPAPFF